MKKLTYVVVGLCVVYATTALASDAQKLKLKNGREVEKIEEGMDVRSNADLNHRVRKLERAVWELQQQCYDLDVEPAPVIQWTCKVQGLGYKMFYGEGSSKGSAEREAMEACQKQGHEMFCSLQSCSSETVR